MRVVQLITQDRGGPVDHAVEVAVELARRGHDSHLVGPPGAHADAAAAQGVRTHLAHMRGKHDLAGAAHVARRVASLRADVLHCQDRRAGMVGRLLGAATATPTTYTLHGVPDPLAPLVPGNLHLADATGRDRLDNLSVERWLARAPRSVVVTPCEAVARYARDHVGLRAERVVAVPNGVQQSWLDGAAPGARTEARSGDRVRVAWLGVMQPVKRVVELVRVVGEVDGVELVLIGDGPQRPLVEAAVAAHAPGRVHLAGFRDDPAPLLRASDVFVLPSAAEACPMALLQAMACGLPVVASRAGGIPEVVRDGVDGLLVDTGDDHQLRSAIRRLAGDAPLRRRLGERGRARVAERFTVRHCVDDLLDVYEGVAR